MNILQLFQIRSVELVEELLVFYHLLVAGSYGCVRPTKIEARGYSFEGVYFSKADPPDLVVGWGFEPVYPSGIVVDEVCDKGSVRYLENTLDVLGEVDGVSRKHFRSPELAG